MAHSGKTMTFATDLVPQEDNIYNLGFEDQRWKIFGDIQPIASKTFSGFYATANNDNRKIAFFGTVTRNSPTIPWRIKLKLTATIPNYPDYAYTDWDIDYWGQGTATKAQYIKVNHGTNYALYSLQIYYPKNTTDNNVLIGVYIYANNNYNNSAYARTIKVDYIGRENCDFSFNNSLLYRESITTADYTAVGITLNATGYQETGDSNSNTYDRTYMNNNKKARGAIVAGSICVGNADGYIGIDNGVTFDITYPILYMGTAINNGAQRSDFYIYQASITSTVNTTGLTHIANGILYMTGTLNGNIFTCNSKILTYTEPSDEDGLIYIPVGINTNATSQSFYFLGGIAQMYWYKDGAFRSYVQVASSVPLSGVTDADDLKVIEALSGTSGLLKKTAANTWTLDTSNYVTSSGITSVTIGATLPVQSSTSTTQNGSSASTTISLADAYGDTKNPYGIKAKNLVLAGPASGSNAAPGFRTLVAEDIPVTFTRAQLINTEQMSFVNQLPRYGSNAAIPVKTMALFADGLAIKSPATANDAAWIRFTGTGEADSVLEIATSDDANNSNAEKIVARQYNSASMIYEATLLGKIGSVYGATSFPVQVEAPKFLKGTSIVPDTGNTTGSVGGTTTPVYVDAGVIKPLSYTIAKSVPSDAVFTDTNNAVTHTADTTAKYYVTGTETATTSTGGDTFDTGIYATTVAGQLNATSYKIDEAVTLQYNSNDSSLEFIFA